MEYLSPMLVPRSRSIPASRAFLLMSFGYVYQKVAHGKFVRSMSEQAYMNADCQLAPNPDAQLTEDRDEPPIDLPQHLLLERSALVQIFADCSIMFLRCMDGGIIVVMSVFDMVVFGFLYFSRSHIMGCLIVFKTRHCHCECIDWWQQLKWLVATYTSNTSTASMFIS